MPGPTDTCRRYTSFHKRKPSLGPGSYRKMEEPYAQKACVKFSARGVLLEPWRACPARTPSLAQAGVKPEGKKHHAFPSLTGAESMTREDSHAQAQDETAEQHRAEHQGHERDHPGRRGRQAGSPFRGPLKAVRAGLARGAPG